MSNIIITSYLENHDACARKNALIEIQFTRVLTESERLELEGLTEATQEFANRMLNFD